MKLEGELDVLSGSFHGLIKQDCLGFIPKFRYGKDSEKINDFP